jgi:hypothetical protein
MSKFTMIRLAISMAGSIAWAILPVVAHWPW